MKQRKRLREAGGDVAGREGTERGQHEGEQAGLCAKQTTGEIGQQKTPDEVEHALEVEDGGIVLRAEDAKAEQQKNGVAG